MNKQTPFARLLLPYQKVYDLPPLFEDFLNLSLLVLSPNAIAGLPWDRESFERILDRYSDPACTLDFVSLFNCLLQEIPKHRESYGYNDVLGDFYEEHILGYDPDNPFSSWGLDELERRSSPLIKIAPPSNRVGEKAKLLDNHCGSGRRLLEKRWLHTINGFYGLEVTPMCAKMAILNLFLNKVPEGEVVCKKADDYSYSFLFGYRFSGETFGIETTDDESKSVVWQYVLDGREVMPQAG